MKNIFILFIFNFIGFTASGFCLQHFNTYGPAYATQTQERFELFTQELIHPKNPTQSPCEAIHLQEVWNSPEINLVFDNMAPSYNIYAPNRDLRIGLMGLFKQKISSQSVYAFQVNNEDGILDRFREFFGVQKGFAVVTSTVPESNQEIDFVNTHLHPSSQAVRIAQILELTQWRSQHRERPMILSGDFNFKVDSLERVLVLYAMGVFDSFELVHQKYPGDFCTYCTANPRGWLNEDAIFDYVFVSQSGGQSQYPWPTQISINLKGIEDFTYSDHYGLIADFKFNNFKYQSSDSELSERMNYLLKIIESSEKVLVSEDSDIFNAALKTLSEIKKDVQNKTGFYYQMAIEK